jgi:hypothetical protein
MVEDETDEELDEAEGEAAGEDDEDDEDDVPHVVLGTVGELASWLSPMIARAHRDRPVWFLLEMDEDFVTVLERLPEGPMEARIARSILEGVRSFASERSDRLQEWLGPTDSIVFGFHTSASLDEVRKAFEADGFLVVGRLREGRVVGEVPVDG